MLTIICGDDTVASRDYFNKLKANFQSKGYEIQNVYPQDLSETSSWEVNSPTLFAEKRLFVTENFLRKFKEKNLSDIPIIDWEEKSLYELKIPKGAKVKEFKPPASIFKLLDSCYPGNLKTFLNILHELPVKMEGGFIFIMLVRFIKNLLLIKTGEEIPRLQSWQLAKLKTQSRHWPLEKLIAFYDSLYRIEVSTKTSTNPFDIRRSLDILACYIL